MNTAAPLGCNFVAPTAAHSGNKNADEFPKLMLQNDPELPIVTSATYDPPLLKTGEPHLTFPRRTRNELDVGGNDRNGRAPDR